MKQMDPELKPLFHELEEDFDWLLQKWNTFEELFGHGEERIHLLNRAAPNFFTIVHQVLFENAMLHLARLADPLKSMGKENRSLERLVTCISDLDIQKVVASHIGDITQKSKFVKEWRNEHIAHTDLEKHRNGRLSSLPEVASHKIRTALSAIRELFRVLRDIYGMEQVIYKGDPWGANALIARLYTLPNESE